MSMFDEMGFCGDIDFFCAPLVEGDVAAPQAEPEATVDDDYSDEEIDVDELERRMWRDKMRLKRLKEQTKSKEGIDIAKQRQSQEQARRKKMSRAQDGILKYMLKMMEVCKAQGFVYGIITEKGKPVTGASDNLREWWKDKVRFDRNGPAAITKYQADNSIPGKNEGSGSLVINDCSEYDVEGAEDEPDFDGQECKPETVTYSNLGMERMRERLPLRQQPYPIKGEVISSMDFIQKRKPSSDINMMVDQRIYTCEAVQCPYSQIRLGFPDRVSRDNHQLNCPFRSTSLEFGRSNFHINEVKPVIFPQPSAQSKPAAPLVNPAPPSFDLSGVPEDGQKMISELMSIYDTNIQGNKNTNPVNNLVTGGHHVFQPKIQHQQDNHNVFQPKIQHQQGNHFRSQGNVIDGNVFKESNINSNHQLFSQEGGQFDRFKPLNSPFETSQNNSSFNLMFSSPLDLSSFEYKEDLQGLGMDSLPKHQQDVSIWF
ncbi:hypothetical protein D5086_018846 [Populus alba]|uniref:Uncharacterized protein n=1 Tax=Populus alba TaxID=43335 RepID=A0ACC4BS56_POPAL